MTSVYELKLGREKLEALQLLLRETEELARIVKAIDFDTARQAGDKLEQIKLAQASITENKTAFDEGFAKFSTQARSYDEVYQGLLVLRARLEALLAKQSGIGSDKAPMLSNLDDMTTPAGFYKTTEHETAGTFPAEWNGKARHANVIVERLDVNWIKQTITEISSDITPSIYYRTNRHDNRTWHEWKELTTGRILPVFDGSKSPSDYTKLPNGLILQWGKKEYFPMGVPFKTEKIVYPVAFPNKVLNITTGINNGAMFEPSDDAKRRQMNLYLSQGDANGTSNAYFTFLFDVPSFTHLGCAFYWFAIGY